MRKKDIEKFDELHSKLLSLKGDFLILSGKKPNDNVNVFKLSIINKVLNNIGFVSTERRYEASVALLSRT